LGLTLDMFKHVLRLGDKVDVEALFKVFDSDGNQKVDAFELLSAAIFLAEGHLEEKIEALFPIFDFSGAGRLSFDEVNILLQSVSRGLTKVCSSQPVGDDELMDACRRAFDAHNLRYDKQVSREQVKRWMRNDVEAVRFIDAFHRACVLSEATAAMTKKQEVQLGVFAQLSGGSASGVSVHDLFRSDALQKSLDNPPAEIFRSFTGALAVTAEGDNVRPELFAEAVQAWNAFSLADADGVGEVDEKELALLLVLWRGTVPGAGVADQYRESLGLQRGDQIGRSAWIAACLRHKRAHVVSGSDP